MTGCNKQQMTNQHTLIPLKNHTLFRTLFQCDGDELSSICFNIFLWLGGNVCRQNEKVTQMKWWWKEIEISPISAHCCPNLCLGTPNPSPCNVQWTLCNVLYSVHCAVILEIWLITLNVLYSAMFCIMCCILCYAQYSV